MSVYDIDIKGLDGGPALLEGLKGKAALFVNVASKCGLTPQYTALEALHAPPLPNARMVKRGP